MAVTATPVFIQTPKLGVQQFLNADTIGTYKTLYTAGANGSKVTGVIVTSTDGTSSHVITLAVQRSATNYIIGAITLGINAGTDGSTPAVDLLAGGASNLIVGLPLDSDGQKYIFLQSGDTLVATFATTVTSAKIVNLTTVAADF